MDGVDLVLKRSEPHQTGRGEGARKNALVSSPPTEEQHGQVGGAPTEKSVFHSPRRWRVLARGVDLVVVTLVWSLVAGRGRPLADSIPVLLIMLAIAVVRLGAASRRTVSIGKLRTIETMELSAASFEMGIALVVVSQLVPVNISNREIVLSSALLLVGWALGRRLTWAATRRLPLALANAQRVILVGDNDEATRLYRLMSEYPVLALDVVGRIGHPLDYDPGLSAAPWLGTHQHVAELIAEHNASTVVIATTGFAPDELEQLLDLLRNSPAEVHLSAGLGGIGRGSLRLSGLGLGVVVQIRSARRSTWQAFAKRTIDLVGAGAILVAVSPVIAMTALVLRLGGDGPVLFRQQRVGRRGVPFTLLKFRSMVCDAEAQLDQLRGDNEREGPLFKITNDPRVTPLGRFLRASSIDELPQLLNVIRGEMSLVGPRPALPEEASSFSGRLQDRNKVKPGITGLWQVESRDNPSFFSYKRLDLFYVDNWTVRLDLAILVTTIPVVVLRGARSVLDALTRQPRQRKALIASS